MNDTDSPEEKIGRLAKALSEMAKPLGYDVTVVPNCYSLVLCRSSYHQMNCVALLCTVAIYGEANRRIAAEMLLNKYESSASHTALFYDRYGGVEFPGGSLEEIELKAAAGWTARPAKGRLW